MNELLKITTQGLNALFYHLANDGKGVFWVRSADCQTQLYVSTSYNLIWQQKKETLYEHPDSWNDYLIDVSQDKIINTIVKNNDSCLNTYKIKLPDGQEQYIQDTSSHLYDSNNQPIAIVGFASPIDAATLENNNGKLVTFSQQQFNDEFTNILSEQFKLTTTTNISKNAREYVINNDNQMIHLTKREAQCLYFLFQGKSAKEIGKILNISHRTVELYCDRIRRKLNCRTRIELLGKISNHTTIHSWVF